jgi:hypothetical protein
VPSHVPKHLVAVESQLLISSKLLLHQDKLCVLLNALAYQAKMRSVTICFALDRRTWNIIQRKLEKTKPFLGKNWGGYPSQI